MVFSEPDDKALTVKQGLGLDFFGAPEIAAAKTEEELIAAVEKDPEQVGGLRSCRDRAVWTCAMTALWPCCVRDSGVGGGGEDPEQMGWACGGAATLLHWCCDGGVPALPKGPTELIPVESPVTHQSFRCFAYGCRGVLRGPLTNQGERVGRCYAMTVM